MKLTIRFDKNELLLMDTEDKHRIDTALEKLAEYNRWENEDRFNIYWSYKFNSSKKRDVLREINKIKRHYNSFIEYKLREVK